MRTRPTPEREFALPLPVVAALATLGSTLCLSALFDGLGWWLWPAAGAITVAFVAGQLARNLRLPLIASPVCYLVFGWIYTIAVAARGSADLRGVGLAPTGSNWQALRALVESGSHDIHTLTVPVPNKPGFLFLTVAGVYLIAVLVDVIAVGLDRPAAAGFPLLVLMDVPAAVVSRGIGVLAFLAAAAGFVALLLASGRRSLSGWARLPAGGAADVRRLTGTAGRRIGATALVASLAVAVVVPRYGGIGHRHHGGSSDSATVIEPVVTLAQQLHSTVVQPLLTVHTATPEYLRLTALDNFDGQQFTLGSLSAGTSARVSHGLPAVAPGTTAKVQATIVVGSVLHQRYLPVPYQATQVSISGDWRLSDPTYTIFSAKNDTANTRYSVTAEVPAPTAATLRSQSAPFGVLAQDTALPGDLPVQISALEAALTRGLTNEYDKVAAIQAYLRGPAFTYDLNGAPTGPNALLDFLLNDHRGYCEQFAGAMAVLVREAGIPARVAVGFTPGTVQNDGSYLVTNHDAHAWPEVWFPQAGWVRFEPTKRDESTNPPAYSVPSSGQTPTPTPTATPSATPSSSLGAPVRKSEAAQPSSGSVGSGSHHGGGWFGAAAGWVAIVLVAGALPLAPAFIRRRRRTRRLARRTGEGQERRAWDEVVDTARDLGAELPPTLSPRRAVEHWARLPIGEGRLPSSTHRVLLDVGLGEELARYGPSGSPLILEEGRVRTALVAWERSCPARIRLRAALLPRSVLAQATGWGRSRLNRLFPARRREQQPVDLT